MKFEFVNTNGKNHQSNFINNKKKVFSLRQFYLKNVFKSTVSNDVERISFLISGLIPSSCTITDINQGIWLISFEKDFGKYINFIIGF